MRSSPPQCRGNPSLLAPDLGKRRGRGRGPAAEDASGTLAAKELGSLTASTGDFAQHSTGGHSDDTDIPQSTVGAADVISRPYRETVGAAEVISRPYR